MIEKIFSKTQYYLIILGIIVVYFLQEKRVLNFPVFINVILFSAAFVCTFLLAYKYHTRKTEDIADCEEEIRKNEDINVFSGPLLNLVGIALISFTVLCALKLPILYYIEHSAKTNPLKVKKVPISNVKLRTNSTIYVDFNGEIESLETKLKDSKRKLGKKKLIENYLVELEYRESIFGTSVLGECKVIKKD